MGPSLEGNGCSPDLLGLGLVLRYPVKGERFLFSEGWELVGSYGKRSGSQRRSEELDYP